jgi:hypothetical protein
MKVLKTTKKEYTLLNGYQKGNNLLQFFKDANDNWVINTDVLEDPAFADIKQELSALTLIDYKPKYEDLLVVVPFFNFAYAA